MSDEANVDNIYFDGSVRRVLLEMLVRYLLDFDSISSVVLGLVKHLVRDF